MNFRLQCEYNMRRCGSFVTIRPFAFTLPQTRDNIPVLACHMTHIRLLQTVITKTFLSFQCLAITSSPMI
jgi:hypothetical protein